MQSRMEEGVCVPKCAKWTAVCDVELEICRVRVYACAARSRLRYISYTAGTVCWSMQTLSQNERECLVAC